jgi:uncharacterized protein YecE (DUF72 family)
VKKRREPELRIGCSGYVYDDWKGIFYPRELPKSRWFDHYASRFDTVEINGTFYHLPEAATFDAWRKRAPRGFRYALKLNRYGTHLKHLKDPEQWVGRFVGRAEHLKSYLGPILVQLPPRWHVDVNRLARFLEVAPRRHRWAVEIRDESWLCDEVYETLADHGAALVIHDLIDHHPRVQTANWVYLRFHGPNGQERYTGDYSSPALVAVAKRVAAHLGEGRDVYAYFNNDYGGRAIDCAERLRRYVESARRRSA